MIGAYARVGSIFWLLTAAQASWLIIFIGLADDAIHGKRGRRHYFEYLRRVEHQQ